MRNTYAFVNAIVVVICGFSSNIIGGWLGDNYEKVNPKIKSRICMIASVFTLPIMCLQLGNHGNYWIS